VLKAAVLLLILIRFHGEIETNLPYRIFLTGWLLQGKNHSVNFSVINDVASP
jgi:hypothetical protein